MLVTVITPSNAAIFPEYILPNIKHIVLDPEISVRCTYAQCIVQIANTAIRYLEMGQALKAHGAFKLSPDAQEYGGAHFEVSSIVGDRSVCCSSIVDILRCQHARPSECHPRASCYVVDGPIQHCKTSRSS